MNKLNNRMVFKKIVLSQKMVNIDGDGKGRELERQIPNLETPQDFYSLVER